MSKYVLYQSRQRVDNLVDRRLPLKSFLAQQTARASQQRNLSGNIKRYVKSITLPKLKCLEQPADDRKANQGRDR
jgi:hypothetical protein